MDTEAKWDYLRDNLGVSEETLQVVTSINGYSSSTLDDVLYAVSGYRSFDQVISEDEDDDDA